MSFLHNLDFIKRTTHEPFTDSSAEDNERKKKNRSSLFPQQTDISPSFFKKSAKAETKEKTKTSENSSVKKLQAKPDKPFGNSIGGKSLPPKLSHSQTKKRHHPMTVKDTPQCSLTLDKLRETPEKLRDFAEKFQAELKILDLKNKIEKKIEEGQAQELKKNQHEILQVAQSILAEKLRSEWTPLCQEMNAIFPNYRKNEYEFLKILFLNFEGPFPFEEATNIQKMQRFQPISRDIFHPPYLLAYNYIVDLLRLGETLKHISLFDRKEEAKDLIFASAHKFEKEIIKLNKKEQTTPISCHDCGEAIILYAKHVAKRLTPYLGSQEGMKACHNQISGNLKKSYRDTLLNNKSSNLQNDIRRMILGHYLDLSSDRKEIDVPAMIPETCKEESPEFYEYQKNLLIFLMQNLRIDIPQCKITEFFNTKDEDETKISLGDLCEKLENTKDESESKLEENLIEMILPHKEKLILPLRTLSQVFLLGIHKAIIFVEKFLDNPNKKIVREFPTVSSPDLLTEGIKLDRETKRIEINFKNDNLTLVFKRVGCLENPPSPNLLDSDPNQEMFKNCSITSLFTFKASIHQIHDWEVKAFVSIERSSEENSNKIFLQRFANLIALLEIMGIDYLVTEI